MGLRAQSHHRGEQVSHYFEASRHGNKSLAAVATLPPPCSQSRDHRRQQMRSEGIPVKHCPAHHNHGSGSTSPLIYYWRGGGAACRLLIATVASSQTSGAAANSSARRAPISVCCRCIGAEINQRLKLAKIMHSIHLRLINTLRTIMHG